MDPRIVRTRSLLIDAALEALETESVADLSVAGLCSRAGVSRVAFYDRFGTIDALLIAAMESELDRVREAAEAISPGGVRDDVPPTDLVEVFRLIGQRATLYRAMLASHGSMGFLHGMRNALRSAVRASMHRIPESSRWPVSPERYFDFVAGSVISVAIGWLSEESSNDAEAVAGELWWLLTHRPVTMLHDRADTGVDAKGTPR